MRYPVILYEEVNIVDIVHQVQAAKRCGNISDTPCTLICSRYAEKRAGYARR